MVYEFSLSGNHGILETLYYLICSPTKAHVDVFQMCFSAGSM